MRVLVIGATGFIGSALVARLTAEGHDVLAAARRVPQTDVPSPRWLAIDMAKMARPEDWSTLLSGVDAVVNCAGALQDAPGQSVEGVHATGPAALFHACAQAGVRRVIHISAVGVDRATPSDFSRTKRAGDEALMASDLDWIILRPSVVVGRSAYGGSALIRGLAALPILPVMPQTAPLQVIHLDDVIDAILHFLKPTASARQIVELVGLKRHSFSELVALFRRWMRWPPAHEVVVPRLLAGAIYRLGDTAALLGWQPPVRSTAEREMARGAIGDASRLRELTNIVPRDVETWLLHEPASVQERWFARLYLLKPLVFVVFSAFWIATGLISLGPGRERGIDLVMEGGVSRNLAILLTVSGGLADIVIGILIAIRRSARLGLIAAFTISVAYAIIGTILVPRLWFDPLGPMLKIAPVMVFNLVALAILEDR